LTTDAPGTTDLNGGIVKTTGAQNYNDAVFLSANATLQTTNGNIEFHSTVDSATSTARNLTLTTLTSGNILLDGAVGGTHALGALAVNSAGGCVEGGGITAGSGNCRGA